MEWIAVGFIRTSHGVHGQLKAESYSGEVEHFRALETVQLRKNGHSRDFSVERIEPFGKGVLIKLKGLDSPEEGKAYAQWEIWVSRSKACRLEKGEYYHADLCGASVLLDGGTVGTVRSVINAGNGDLLEVVLSEEKEVKLIPFRKEFIGPVDPESKSIELIAPWILE